MLECREFDQRLTAHASSRDGGWNRSMPRSGPRYFAFLQDLQLTAHKMVQPLNPALVVDVFYATMILTMIRRILLTSESSRAILGSGVTEYGSSAMGATSVSYQPMMRVLELSNKTFEELCYHGYCKRIWEQYSSLIEATQWLVRVSHKLSEELKDFIDRVELK